MEDGTSVIAGTVTYNTMGKYTIAVSPTKDGENYTRNEWKRCKTTLETSGEDVKTHSKRVHFFSRRRQVARTSLVQWPMVGHF